MNKRGFALAAGFLFLAVTVLFIVSIHVAQLEYQSASMSRSTVMDKLHYQKVDKVQAFWSLGKITYDSFTGTPSIDLTRDKFLSALRGWNPSGLTYHNPEEEIGTQNPNEFSSIDPDTGTDWIRFRLNKSASITGNTEVAGWDEEFQITDQDLVVVTENKDTGKGTIGPQ